MITIRRSEDRGSFDFDWLQTKHTFSFGDYYNPQQMRFRTLRVINQDIVQPGRGFDTHHHKNMEIITYVLRGAVTHRDTMGNEAVVSAGEVQCMSAGHGVFHSEYNTSATQTLELLQIWILPAHIGIKPSYQQMSYDKNKLGLQLLVSSDGAENSLIMHQDAKLFRALLQEGEDLSCSIAPDRALWVQMIAGKITIDEQELQAGDGAAITLQDKCSIVVKADSEFLLFDVK